MDIKDIRIQPFSYSESSFVLKYTDRNKYSRNKQVRSFMPNLIHSLDAASLTILIDKFFENDTGIRSIYGVHDCFAVTCNNAVELTSLLKISYINIYSNVGYLRKLDMEIKHHIINHYGKDCFDDKSLIIKTKTKTLKYPDIEVILENSFDVEKNILDSLYIVN